MWCFRCKQSVFSIAGTKDRRGITTQEVTAFRYLSLLLHVLFLMILPETDNVMHSCDIYALVCLCVCDILSDTCM